MNNCPVCKSPFTAKGRYSECSNMKCPTLLFGDRAIHVDFTAVKNLLNHPVLKTNKFAKKLASFLNEKGFLTSGQLLYIIGDSNPKGDDTYQKIVQKRTNQKPVVGKIYTSVEDTVAPPVEDSKEETAEVFVGVEVDPSPILEDAAFRPIMAKPTAISTITDSDIMVVTGKDELFKTKDFPFVEYNFEHFNPLQSTTVKYIEEDKNVVVAASTSSGKTIVAEQFIAATIAKGKKALYISPLKALTQEKYDDWGELAHTFSKYKTEILTGDYILTPSRVKDLNNADIILLSSEMWDSRTRKIKSEMNDWLYAVGVVVIDEAHLLGMDGRGDNLECAIMRFTEQNPSSKIVLLSATMPNVLELANWLKYLNGKDSILIKSDWRPVQLDLHFPTYSDRGYYREKEANKAEEVYKILKQHPHDKFIVFVHTKSLGRVITEMIRTRLREEVEFHSSDLTKENRWKLEKSFKQKDGGLRLLVATSTLAWGINAPARRVIVAGVHRGMSEVTAMEIIQMVGRSGRYGIDDKGDAYVLLPESTVDLWINKITKSENVESRMIEPRVLSFHVISEIVRGVIRNREELHDWYTRTLAHFQDTDVNIEDFVEDIETALVNYRALKIENGQYTPTGLGKVSAWMYYHPSDVFHWYASMSEAVNNNIALEDNPLWISYILSQYTEVYPPAHVQPTLDTYERRCSDQGIDNHPSLVNGYAIYSMLNATPLDDYFFPIIRGIQRDIDRVVQAVSLVDKLYGMWKLPNTTYSTVKAMVQYGISKEYADICRVRWIGGKKAKELYKAGIRKVEDVANPKYKKLIEGVLKKHTDEAIESANKILSKKED